MNNIYHVLAGAVPQFKKKGEKMNRQTLIQSLPEQITKASKPALVSKPIDNPSTVGLEGKDGKTYFFIRVGEVKNLYRTSKRSSKKDPANVNAVLDLHGYIKYEALSKLDECLPRWVDIAMKGEYPWVILVKIVCGGGNQILSEAVENWIKQNKNVPNAPKSICS